MGDKKISMTPTEFLSEELRIGNGFHAIEESLKDEIVHEKLTGVASTSCR